LLLPPRGKIPPGPPCFPRGLNFTGKLVDLFFRPRYFSPALLSSLQIFPSNFFLRHRLCPQHAYFFFFLDPTKAILQRIGPPLLVIFKLASCQTRNLRLKYRTIPLPRKEAFLPSLLYDSLGPSTKTLPLRFFSFLLGQARPRNGPPPPPRLYFLELPYSFRDPHGGLPFFPLRPHAPRPPSLIPR